MKKSVLLCCLFLITFGQVWANSTSQSDYKPIITFCVYVGIVLIVAIIALVRINSKKDNKSEHAIEVSNRTKLDYWDKCRLMITNFNNTREGIAYKINSAVAASKARLQYEYSHNIDHDLKALLTKINQVSKLDKEQIIEMSLEKISSLYYSLNTLMRSYGNVARDIEITTNSMINKRIEYDSFINQARNLYDRLKTEYKDRALFMREADYDLLINIKEKKEEHYDALLSLIMYYESLVARYSSEPNNKRILNQALTKKLS